MKPKKLKMRLCIVADDVHAIKGALQQIANGKLISNEYVMLPGGVECDYDFVSSDNPFSKDSNKKVIDPNADD